MIMKSVNKNWVFPLQVWSKGQAVPDLEELGQVVFILVADVCTEKTDLTQGVLHN